MSSYRGRPKRRRGLAHAGLGDLFENVLESVLPALPAPRRHALEVALLVEEDPDGFDPRTLGVAVRSALEVLAADGPVVLAIDDVQWLDPSSASALAFALRRLGERSILLLLARRLGERAETSDLESAIRADRVERLRVGPLSLGAIHQLLQAHLALTLARPTLLRVHETSGGNPFYALELARALGADVDPTQPLRVPESLEGLVRARVDKLPPATQESLLLAAAAGRPSVELFANLDVTEHVLDRAARRACDRAHGRDDSLHTPAARLGGLPRRVCARATARTRTPRPGRRGSARPRPPPRAFDGEPGQPDRRCSRGCRGLGGHPRRTDRRRRARGARAPAHAAGRPQRPASSSARCGARPAQRGRVDARAKRFLPISSRRDERAPCAPRRLSCLPSWRANVVPSHCSRKPCARRLRGQRFSQSSTVGSRGRAPSQGSTMHVERSSSPTSSTTTSCEDRPVRCKPSSVGSPAKRKHRRIFRRGSATSRALSVANCWCGRRLWPS